MDKFCTHCGQPLKEGAGVCLSCGKLLHVDNQPIIKKINTSSLPSNEVGFSISLISGFALFVIAFVWMFANFFTLSGFAGPILFYILSLCAGSASLVFAITYTHKHKLMSILTASFLIFISVWLLGFVIYFRLLSI